jgi:adenine-specific DNA-methyltransferase
LTTSPEERPTVIDFFAGTGTTGNAVINLNREDEGQRQFVLVEMGDYFDDLLVPRISKIMYTPDWQDGKPRQEPIINSLWTSNGVNEGLPDWIERSPRLVKLLRLESYDDSLNALELPQERDARMAGQLRLWGDEYLLKYMLNTEAADSPVLLNTRLLEAPLDYRLRLFTPDGERNVPVDLVETFNLLMGLHVRRVRELRDPDSERPYVVVEALQDGREVLVVWRNVAGLDPAKERRFLTTQLPSIAEGRYTTIYTNADSAMPNGQSLDMLLKDRMLKPETERGGLE